MISKATPVEHGKVYQSPLQTTMRWMKFRRNRELQEPLLMKSHLKPARDRKSTDRVKDKKHDFKKEKRIVKRHTFQTYRRQKALNYSKLKKWEEAPIKAEQEDQDSPTFALDVVPMP